MRVLVVGAGVTGLTCALRLLEAGHRVDVLARDLPRETTSAVAGALWYPYRAWPQEQVLAWSAVSYGVFAQIAASEPDAGVAMRAGTEVVARRGERPWWADAVADLGETLDVPAGYAAGWTFTAPLLEMPVYLAWLTARVEAAGGSVTRMNLQALPTPASAGLGGPDVVVDCAGLGAKHLAADPSVHPVQGQVLRVAQVGLERWWLDAAGPTYVFPRTGDILVGGTDVENEWSRTPSPEVADAILRRALRLVPELAGAPVLGHKVGLRPARAAVRVERVGDVVHCYGHGGAGVTLSWGCAADVVALVGS